MLHFHFTLSELPYYRHPGALQVCTFTLIPIYTGLYDGQILEIETDSSYGKVHFLSRNMLYTTTILCIC